MVPADRVFTGCQMSFRKLLISLSLVTLLAMPAMTQNQASQTPSAQQPQSTPPASGTSSGNTTASTPAPPQNPPATPSATPAPPADSASSSASSGSAPGGPPPVQEPDPSKVKHTGGEDDVDAIGNRNVGKRGFGDWYSLETEIRMGKQYSMQVENSVKMVQDPVVNEYVNRIGQNLVRNSDAQVPFTIKVIDSDEINAFALPGGFFYVNSGLILAADEEAELAGVMAHEISHVCARHGMRQTDANEYCADCYHSFDLRGRWVGLRNLRGEWLGLAAHVHEVPAQFRSGSGLPRSAIYV